MTHPPNEPTPSAASPTGGAVHESQNGDPARRAVPYTRFAALSRQKRALAAEVETLRARLNEQGKGQTPELDGEVDSLKAQVAQLQVQLATQQHHSAIRLAAHEAGAADPEDILRLLQESPGEQAPHEAVMALKGAKPYLFTRSAPSGMPAHPAAAPHGGPLLLRANQLRQQGDTLGLLMLAQEGG